MLAAQYLEAAHPEATPRAARERLRRAFDILPLDVLLLGWDLPISLEEAAAEECLRYGAELYRWHPLFTGSSADGSWRTTNRHNHPIPGYRNLPEFTFLCPNRPEVLEFAHAQIEQVIRRGLFRGLFLDRMRFPSPSAAPDEHLACFCEYCGRAAHAQGLDLQAVRRQIDGILSRSGGRIELTGRLFRPDLADDPLEAFLAFRADSVTRAVEAISMRLTACGMQTGLDCFSPSLTRMVGQDLGALDRIGAWTKIMTYPRAFGPAGLPFELLRLWDWLQGEVPDRWPHALREFCGLQIPPTRTELAQRGLASSSISHEIALARKMGVRQVLAGLALVQFPGVNAINLDQARADLEAAYGADGLVLSWDLWLIPDEFLRLARSAA